MTLTLHFHPLSSYSWKALIALYEKGATFEPVIVDPGDPASAARLREIWPLRKFPVLADSETGQVLPESTIIVEYLDQRLPDAPLLPADPDTRLEARLWDRIFDLHVHTHMQRIVADRIRPEEARDARGVAEARASLFDAYELIEGRMSGRDWAAGGAFGLADCAAAPALFYAGIVAPFGDRPSIAAYLERLMARPTFRRVLVEARPWFPYFPFHDDMPARFRDPEAPAP